MGILSSNLSWLTNICPPPASMLELGSQDLFIDDKPKSIAKYYWQDLGYEHVSIDLNGEYDSLKLDLRDPIDLGRQFDIITDFGTSEHVSDLYACFKNVFNLLKVGGFTFHINPMPGHW